MKDAIWISYDLGIRGDYEGMYNLLDSLGAVDCGDSLAFCKFEHEGELLTSLKAVIREHVKIERRSRVYVIFPVENGKHRGRFLFGHRKRPAWTGYADQAGNEEDESG